MRTIEDVCERLHDVRLSEDTGAIESALSAADKAVVSLFYSMSADEVFRYRDARKVVQVRLNRLRAARKRA